jgi:hypothetical protein
VLKSPIAHYKTFQAMHSFGKHCRSRRADKISKAGK